MTEADFQTFEAVGAMVVVLDPDGRIVHWNHCCSDLTGYSLDEVRGRRLWDLVLLPEEVEAVKAVFAKPASNHASSYANYWVTKTGAQLWIVFSHTTTTHPDGSLQYVIKTGIDQSDRKRAELALSASEARLSARAVESARLYEDARHATDDLREANQHMVSATIRAQEVAQRVEAALTRSEESERDLRAAAEFREMFIGVVGHDLRNPLGAIALTAELLLARGHLEQHDREIVSHVVSSCQRMTRMITQLLDFTRVRLGGGFPIDPTPGDLRDVCRVIGQEFGAPLQLELEGDLTGRWDPDRLAEALSNITGNAVEHAASGTPVVIRAHPEGEEVVVEISNRGSAIPADLLPVIFEPFQRGKREMSPAGNLGLGLYIAKQIVLAGGGKLDARSADGTTTFVMRLPRQGAGGPASSKAEARESARG